MDIIAPEAETRSVTEALIEILVDAELCAGTEPATVIFNLRTAQNFLQEEHGVRIDFQYPQSYVDSLLEMAMENGLPGFNA